MRLVRYSRTFLGQLHDLLAQGHAKFGSRVIAEKSARVYDTIDFHIAEFPATGAYDRRLRLYTYPISQTPLVVIYDFDEAELRMHMIVHGRADRRRLDPRQVEW
jgi:hypothetical protein